MTARVIIVTPHLRPDGRKHPNAFDARLAGSDAVLCVSETPLLDSARVLLKAGKGQPGRYAGDVACRVQALLGAGQGREACGAHDCRNRVRTPPDQIPGVPWSERTAQDWRNVFGGTLGSPRTGSLYGARCRDCGARPGRSIAGRDCCGLGADDRADGRSDISAHGAGAVSGIAWSSCHRRRRAHRGGARDHGEETVAVALAGAVPCGQGYRSDWA